MELDKALLEKIKNVTEQEKPAIVTESSETPNRRLTTEFKVAFGERTITEEKDPDDSKTGNLFPALNDEPELQTIHHKAELHVTHNDTNQNSKHLIGLKSYHRTADETATAFKNRVMNEVTAGHGTYDENAGDSKQVPAYTPYNSYDELSAEEGSHSLSGDPRWMHVASGGTISHAIDDGSNGVDVTVHHYLQAGHKVKPTRF